MIIQSYDRWVVMAEYDPGSGAVKEFTRPPKGAFVCTGHYASLSGILAVLYRSNGALWLRIGAGVRNLDQTAVSVRFHSEAEFSFLELIDGQDVVVGVRYRNKLDELRSDDPTPFVEPEHFDFGLFVKNVVEDTARRGRIYALDLER